MDRNSQGRGVYLLNLILCFEMNLILILVSDDINITVIIDQWFSEIVKLIIHNNSNNVCGNIPCVNINLHNRYK